VPPKGDGAGSGAGAMGAGAGRGAGLGAARFFAAFLFFVFLAALRAAFFIPFFFFLRAGAARFAFDFFVFAFFRFFDFAMIILPIGSTKTRRHIRYGILPQPISPYSAAAAAGARPAFSRSTSGIGPPVAQSMSSTV